DEGEQGGGGGGLVGEVAQVPPRRLVGAVLAPHHRVQGEFRVGRPAPEQVADPLVLLGGQPQFPVWLEAVRGGRGERHTHVHGLPRGRFAGFGRRVLAPRTPQRRLGRLTRRSARRVRRGTLPSRPWEAPRDAGVPRGRFAGFGRRVLAAGTPQRRLGRLTRRSARRLRRDALRS